MENQARRAADRTSAAGGQAMDGLSAGLGVQPTRPQRSNRRQGRSALPTAMPIFTCESGLHLQGLLLDPRTYEPYSLELGRGLNREELGAVLKL